MKNAISFLPETADDRGPYGRTIHFGIREHAMGAALNGIALHGGTRPYGGTFLVFSDYMRGSVRLAALMGLPVIYVWTHDSIGLGGDGPTHQPIEHLAALRAMPGLDVVRPADANETVVAWRTTLEQPTARWLWRCPGRTCRPSTASTHGSAEGVAKGAYVLAEAEHRHPQGDPHRDRLRGRAGARRPARRLEAEGTPTRVVSMPCREWFMAQEPSYRQTVLPPSVRARVSVEAGGLDGLARIRRRFRRVHLGRTLRRQRPVRDHLRAVRHHPRAQWSPRPTPACPRSEPPTAPRPATDPATHPKEGLHHERSPTPAERGRRRGLAR